MVSQVEMAEGPLQIVTGITEIPKIESVTLQQYEASVRRQVNRFVGLGFHEVLSQKEEEYRRGFTLPESGFSQPEAYQGRFDILLVVDPRLSLPVVHKRAGVDELCKIEEIRNLTPVPSGPYVAWTHDASRYGPFSVEEALAYFADDEVGSPQVEVTGMYLHYPEFFEKYSIYASGSCIGGDRGVPYLYRFRRNSRVVAGTLDNKHPSWGVLSRGREITQLGC